MGESLADLIRGFYQDKQVLDNYKKSTDEYNKEIKERMTQLNMNEFVTSEGIVAKIIVQNRDSFIESKLLNKLKELGATKAIKQIEIVDYDVLEDLIYNNELDASELSGCKENKEVITLKVSKKKGE